MSKAVFIMSIQKALLRKSSASKGNFQVYVCKASIFTWQHPSKNV